MDKQAVLMRALREILINSIIALEDYLDIPLDRSALAKRREKVRA